mmetsp:Transcript_17148/g.56122  ORF Transcript_17148/g.56122 Transcript_17148/m.56122 type:complete len:169 (-) Transcript_17148:29-535(-)
MAPTAVEKQEELRKKLKEAFKLFELEMKDKRGMCDEREIPTIVRSLNINPTQEQLRDIVTEVRGDENTSGYVEYARFERVMLRALTEQAAEFARDPEEKLLRAFRAFDPEGKGYVDAEYLKNLCMTRGDALRPEEAQEMLAAAVDEDGSGIIYYEDFVELLSNDGREL